MQENDVVNASAVNETAISESVANQSASTKYLKVYRHKSTFKGAGDNDYYYTATRSDGSGVFVHFKCKVELDLSAFEIFNAKGNLKATKKVKDGKEYTNYDYYIQSCSFREIEGEDLPF